MAVKGMGYEGCCEGTRKAWEGEEGCGDVSVVVLVIAFHFPSYQKLEINISFSL